MQGLKKILILGMLLVLSSCADTEWPQWLSGEPSKAELDAYKGPIAMPAQTTEGKEWPNLADVPERPKVLMGDAEKNKLIDEMKQKNVEGVKEIEAFKAQLTPPPKTKKPTKPVKKKKKTRRKHIQ